MWTCVVELTNISILLGSCFDQLSIHIFVFMFMFMGMISDKSISIFYRVTWSL